MLMTKEHDKTAELFEHTLDFIEKVEGRIHGDYEQGAITQDEFLILLRAVRKWSESTKYLISYYSGETYVDPALGSHPQLLISK